MIKTIQIFLLGAAFTCLVYALGGMLNEFFHQQVYTYYENGCKVTKTPTATIKDCR